MKTAFLLLLLAIPLGSEFQANTRTSLNQANAAITTDPNGSFLVVWSSYFSSNSNDIIGRRFNSDCNGISTEFTINTVTAGNQTEPSVASDSFGNFVVTWQGPGLIEGDDGDIFARRYDANGTPPGQQWLVNSDSNNIQQHPQIAFNSAGKSVIVWDSNNTGSTRNIRGQLYDNNSFCTGKEFIVNDEIYDSRFPDVVMDSNGGFAVVWMQGKNTTNNIIKARLYNADGSARTPSLMVSTNSFSSLTRPAIAMGRSGSFIITWDGDPNRAKDDDIHARIFEPNGAPLGGQFIVNTTIKGQQQNPQIAMNNTGDFVIVWDSNSTIDPNINNKAEIQGQRYDSSGRRIGSEFRLNTFMEKDQKNPDIVLYDNGKFIAVWQSDEQDGSGWGIFGSSGSFTTPADLNADGVVDFRDYSFLAYSWGKEDTLLSDLVIDGKIDGLDLAEFCRRWLKEYK